MSEKQLRIDVHHHMVPDEYKKELGRIGLTESLGMKLPEWSAELSIEMMERNNINAAVTSISSPGVFFGDIEFSKRLSRICNDVSARLIGDYPNRFGAFATLPLPDIQASIQEVEYIYDTLHLDGIVLMSNYKGIYPGDSAFEELYAELNKRKAVVYVHPTDPHNGNPLGDDIPNFLIEVTFDTTRAIFNLLYKGVFELYPNIRWIFSHAGGTLPYLAWRISLGQFVLPEADKNVCQGALKYLENLYYDTALSANPYALRSLKELAGPSQIVFGSDFPFAPEVITMETINGIALFDGFDDNDRSAVESKNLLKASARIIDHMC